MFSITKYSTEDFSRKLKEVCIGQFPKIKGTWVMLDREQIKYRLSSTFRRNDLENMKFLQNIPDQYDRLFAPFCAIFQIKPFTIQYADGLIEKNYKKPFIIFVTNAHFINSLLNFDLTKIKEETAMQV